MKDIPLTLPSAAEDDSTLPNNREVDRLHADQESILEHLGGGPQGWPAVRRRLHVLGSETRASQTRCQLAALIGRGLIEEYDDAQYRLTEEGLTATLGPARVQGFEAGPGNTFSGTPNS